MEARADRHTQSGAAEHRSALTGFARGSQLGLSVLVVFTVKGVCTTAMIVFSLIAVSEDGGIEMLPHLVVWSIACIGGLGAVGGWHTMLHRAARRRSKADEILNRTESGTESRLTSVGSSRW